MKAQRTNAAGEAAHDQPASPEDVAKNKLVARLAGAGLPLFEREQTDILTTEQAFKLSVLRQRMAELGGREAPGDAHSQKTMQLARAYELTNPKEAAAFAAAVQAGKF